MQPRMNTNGAPVALGQPYTWVTDVTEGSGEGNDGINNVLVPFSFAGNNFAGDDVASQLLMARRILRPIGGQSVGSELVEGLVTMYNAQALVPSLAGDVTVKMRVGTLQEMGTVFAPEVARLVIPAAAIAALTGPTVAPLQLGNWTTPTGGALDEIEVIGGNQFVAVTVDIPDNSNMSAVFTYVDWRLQ